jgi:hypothetical protein
MRHTRSDRYEDGSLEEDSNHSSDEGTGDFRDADRDALSDAFSDAVTDDADGRDDSDAVDDDVDVDDGDRLIRENIVASGTARVRGAAELARHYRSNGRPKQRHGSMIEFVSTSPGFPHVKLRLVVPAAPFYSVPGSLKTNNATYHLRAIYKRLLMPKPGTFRVVPLPAPLTASHDATNSAITVVYECELSQGGQLGSRPPATVVTYPGNGQLLRGTAACYRSSASVRATAGDSPATVAANAAATTTQTIFVTTEQSLLPLPGIGASISRQMFDPVALLSPDAVLIAIEAARDSGGPHPATEVTMQEQLRAEAAAAAEVSAASSAANARVASVAGRCPAVPLASGGAVGDDAAGGSLRLEGQTAAGLASALPELSTTNSLSHALLVSQMVEQNGAVTVPVSAASLQGLQEAGWN